MPGQQVSSPHPRGCSVAEHGCRRTHGVVPAPAGLFPCDICLARTALCRPASAGLFPDSTGRTGRAARRSPQARNWSPKAKAKMGVQRRGLFPFARASAGSTATRRPRTHGTVPAAAVIPIATGSPVPAHAGPRRRAPADLLSARIEGHPAWTYAIHTTRSYQPTRVPHRGRPAGSAHRLSIIDRSPVRGSDSHWRTRPHFTVNDAILPKSSHQPGY
jgi:hypothetical protein